MAIAARQPATRAPSGSRANPRTRFVWTALLAAMTTVGGGLYLLDRSPPTNLGGVTLPALMASGTPRSIEVIFDTSKSIEKGRWKSIVIHHSGAPSGTPRSLEQEAVSRNLRGMGWHFVIGNGNGIDDGELHVGRRWVEQTAGAHTGGKDADWYNVNSIGLCLIGDGNRRGFTQAQFDRLVELTAALCREMGIPKDRVVLHSDVANTTDPGRMFPERAFRDELAARL